MIKSLTIGELAKALSKFQIEVGVAKKTSNNPFFKSSYCPLEEIIATIKKPLNDNGLSYTQFPTGNSGLTTILMHNSGEFLEETYYMSPDKNTPQGIGSALSYMRRYSLGAILGIATEDDDDAEKATDHDKQDTLFDKAKKAIETAKDFDRLDVLKAKFDAEKKLTDKEKAELAVILKKKGDGFIKA